MTRASCPRVPQASRLRVSRTSCPRLWKPEKTRPFGRATSRKPKCTLRLNQSHFSGMPEALHAAIVRNMNRKTDPTSGPIRIRLGTIWTRLGTIGARLGRNRVRLGCLIAAFFRLRKMQVTVKQHVNISRPSFSLSEIFFLWSAASGCPTYRGRFGHLGPLLRGVLKQRTSNVQRSTSNLERGFPCKSLSERSRLNVGS